MIPADRRSYRGLLAMPAWGLYDSYGMLVASVRAEDAVAARDIFRRSGFSGFRVRRITDSPAR